MKMYYCEQRVAYIDIMQRITEDCDNSLGLKKGPCRALTIIDWED